MNILDYRKEFPLLAQERTVYLDSAATSQRPQCVLDAERDFYLNHNANPLRGFYPLSVEATEIYEAARETVRARRRRRRLSSQGIRRRVSIWSLTATDWTG